MKGDWTAAEMAAFAAWAAWVMKSLAVITPDLHPATVHWLEGVLGHGTGPG